MRATLLLLTAALLLLLLLFLAVQGGGSRSTGRDRLVVPAKPQSKRPLLLLALPANYWLHVLLCMDSRTRAYGLHLKCCAKLRYAALRCAVLCRYIEGLVEQQVAAGIPSTRIVVSGFSQGGALALLMLRSKVRAGRRLLSQHKVCPTLRQSARLPPGFCCMALQLPFAQHPLSQVWQVDWGRRARCSFAHWTTPCVSVQHKLAGVIALSAYLPLHEEKPVVSGKCDHDQREGVPPAPAFTCVLGEGLAKGVC